VLVDAVAIHRSESQVRLPSVGNRRAGDRNVVAWWSSFILRGEVTWRRRS
jgi:hypothetical protein